MYDLSPAAQHWTYLVLIWVGFGTLAGLAARAVLPLREPSGLLPTLTLGITGSAVGLGVFSWLLPEHCHNPISPLGFLAATGGAFALLLLYAVQQALARRAPPPKKKPRPGRDA